MFWEICYCAGEKYRQTIQSLLQFGFVLRDDDIRDEETLMEWPSLAAIIVRIKAKSHAIPTALQLVVDDLSGFRNRLASHLYTAVSRNAIRLQSEGS